MQGDQNFFRFLLHLLQMWEIWQAPETVLKTSQISSLTPTVVFHLSELAFMQRHNSWSDEKKIDIKEK